MLIRCEVKGKLLNPKLKENCPSCIFNRQQKDEDGYFYLVCDYDNFHPGLKRGKDESNNS